MSSLVAFGSRSARPRDVISRTFGLVVAFFSLAITGCASMGPSFEEPEVSLVNVKPLPSNGVEQRFQITVRILNPNDRDLSADGLDLILDLNGERLGRGVSSTPFVIPQLSDGTVELVATTHLLDVVRQAFAFPTAEGQMKYQLRGRIRLTNSIGWIRFTREGNLLPEQKGGH